jgi:restriction endonuclease S subunit
MPVVRRSVLESIEIPIPPLEVQSKIAKLDVLLQKELELIDKLAAKRRELITAACMQAVRNS